MATILGDVPSFNFSGVVFTEEDRSDTLFRTDSMGGIAPVVSYSGSGFTYDLPEEPGFPPPVTTLLSGHIDLATESFVGMHFSGYFHSIEDDTGWSVAEIEAHRGPGFLAWLLAGDDKVTTQNDFDGFDGNDTITYGPANTLYAGPPVRFSGGNGDDVLIGGHPLLNILEGGPGNDTLIGGNPDDRLEGGPGADTLIGGGGNDAAYYRNATEGVVVNLDTGVGSGGEAEGDTFESIENIHGSEYSDILTGNGVANLIMGEGGDDILQGLAGIDTLIGGPGDDVLDGGTGADYLLGGEGNDTYHVDDTFDLVDEDVVFPDFGHGGTDTIVSTANWFWDVYSVGEIDRIAENASDPTGSGVTFVGGIFDNVLYGHSGTDILFGRGGNDIYRAGDGVDWISLSTLGVNDDNAYKGVDGHNTVIVDPRSTGKFSYDIIFEFESGKDKVDVSAYGSQYASGADVLSHAVDDGAGSSYIALGDGLDYLYFVGLSKTELLASDFVV